MLANAPQPLPDRHLLPGRILEIEGLPDLKIEQAFELTDASAERSAAGCAVLLNKVPIVEYLRSNITLMKWMIAEGYEDRGTLARRIKTMQEWIARGTLLAPMPIPDCGIPGSRR